MRKILVLCLALLFLVHVAESKRLGKIIGMLTNKNYTPAQSEARMMCYARCRTKYTLLWGVYLYVCGRNVIKCCTNGRACWDHGNEESCYSHNNGAIVPPEEICQTL